MRESLTYNRELSSYLQKTTTVQLSSYHELLMSLHVISRPEHHPFRVKWVENIVKELPEDLLTKITKFSKVTDQFLQLANVEMIYSRFFSVEDGIKQLTRLSPAEFVYVLLYERFRLDQIIQWLHKENSEWKTLLFGEEKELILNTEKIQSEIVTLLKDYNEHVFQREWRLIEPWLVRAKKQFVEQLEQKPIQTMSQLHPRLFIKEDAIYAQKATMYRFDYARLENIVVMLSTFVHPHLLIGIGETVLHVPSFVEVPSLSKQEAPPADLIHLFKILSDPTRLNIIRSLFQQPHCTQQLAQIHHVTEAAVSKHLKQLVKGNIVEIERRGNYLFYGLKKDDMERVLVYLRQFLEQ